MRSATTGVRWLRTAAEEAQRRAPRPVIRVVSRVAESLRASDPFDRAMTLAAQAFTSLFPLLIAIAALLPDGSGSLSDHVGDALGMPDSSRKIIEQALPPHSDTRGLFGVFGILVVLVSATSFSRALARMYGKVWQVTPPGWTGGWRWVATVLGVLLAAITLRVLRALSSGLYATVGQLLVALVLGVLLWTWAPWLLLGGQVSWRRLLPGGAVMGFCTIAISVASGIYLPHALVSASRQYGSLGIAFTYISWLFIVAVALVCSTVLGAVLADDESRLARLIVGTRPDPAEQR